MDVYSIMKLCWHKNIKIKTKQQIKIPSCFPNSFNTIGNKGKGQLMLQLM